MLKCGNGMGLHWRSLDLRIFYTDPPQFLMTKIMTRALEEYVLHQGQASPILLSSAMQIFGIKYLDVEEVPDYH